MKLIKVKFKNRTKSFEYYQIFVEGEFSIEFKSDNNYTLDDIATMFSLSIADVKLLIK
jgi:hypothetical protein